MFISTKNLIHMKSLNFNKFILARWGCWGFFLFKLARKCEQDVPSSNSPHGSIYESWEVKIPPFTNPRAGI